MPIKVLIPTPLRQYTENKDHLELEGQTIGQLIGELVTRYKPLRRYLLTDEGKLRNFVNVYVNEEDIRYLKEQETPVKNGDTVIIVPSIAGGGYSGEEEGPSFSQEEFRRYGRHLIMPEVGLRGQGKLKQAKVLLVGAGGLGSPAALYLAAGGVGTIGIVDFDVVEHSNLQRQVVYSSKDVGRPKLQAATERLGAVNPNVRVIPHETRLTSENALEILKDYDVVVDGTDNFPTRYLVNDACVLLKKPNVYGSIFRFDGQATVFDATRGPCYRCLYPEPPPPGLVPSCAEGGVLGVLPGIIGTIQATEVIKLILGAGEPLIGRLLMFDAFKMQTRQVKLRKDPNCSVCGPNPTVTHLIDYEEFCGIGHQQQYLGEEWEIEPGVLKKKLDEGSVLLVDVREPHEHEICHIKGSKLIPLNSLPDRVNELNTSDEIVLHCHQGPRSQAAVNFLRELGFRKVKNLTGGIDAWAEKIEPDMPRY